MKNYLEIGKITGTRGLNGELKVQPWCDSPEVLAGLEKLYLDDGETPLNVNYAKVHKSMVIMSVVGVNTIEQADKLKNKILCVNRSDLKLEEGRYFIQDLIGLSVVNADSGIVYGKITDVFKTGANDVYQVTNHDNNYLVPVIPQVVINVDIDNGTVQIRPLKGIFDDEN